MYIEVTDNSHTHSILIKCLITGKVGGGKGEAYKIMKVRKNEGGERMGGGKREKTIKSLIIII